MSVFITSDTHFLHSNIIRLCGRPFSNAEEQDETLIANGNSVVKPQDSVYFLGDLCGARTDQEFKVIKEYVSRLNGKERIGVFGNHDSSEQRKRLSSCFTGTTNYIEIKFNGIKYCLMHYPLYEGNGAGGGSIMLHGHCHYRYPDWSNKKIFDVGVDAGNFYPVRIEALEELAKTKANYVFQPRTKPT